MRRLLLWFAVAGVVTVAVLVKASAVLLGAVETAPVVHAANDVDRVRSRAPGPHPVGVDAYTIDGLDTVLWYPAEAAPGTGATYSFALDVADPIGRVWLGTYRGVAIRTAPPDLGGGPYPLVVLSPGFAMSSTSYAWLGEHLASHGFVVASPDHDETLDPSRLGVAAMSRPADITATLDRVESDLRFADMVDVDRVAVVGHSLGGFTALAMGGGRVDIAAFADLCDVARAEAHTGAWLCDAVLPQAESMAAAAGLDAVPDGLWPEMGDRRVDAVVTMAGDAFLMGRDGLAEIEVPLLVVGGTADRDAPFEWSSQLAFDHASSATKEILPLAGAAHMIFTNPCQSTRRLIDLLPNEFCDDVHWDRTDAHRLVADRVTGFLTDVLGGG